MNELNTKQEDQVLEEKKTENSVTFLDKVKAEREALEQTRKDVEKLMTDLREMKAQEMIAGKTDAGQSVEKPKEETPADYAKRVMGKAV